MASVGVAPARAERLRGRVHSGQRFDLRTKLAAAAIALMAGLVPARAIAERSVPRTQVAPASATVRACADVTFQGVADFRLKHIRATGVSCSLARRVVRGARLHQRWRSQGFSCKVTGTVPEVATLYRCTNGPRQVITFRAG